MFQDSILHRIRTINPNKTMKKYISYIYILMAAAFFAACQDKDLPGEGAMIVAAPDASQIKGELNGYDYTISWPMPEGEKELYLTYYVGGDCKQSWMKMIDNSFTVYNLEAGEEYRFVFKYKEEITEDGDKTSIWSQGTNVTYTRPGAASIKNLKVVSSKQADDTWVVQTTWNASYNADAYVFTATNGSRIINETLAADITSYTIPNVNKGDTWTVTVMAKNNEGQALVKEESTVVGFLAFLSQYDTPEALLKDGDDDEASAWLWFKENYPTGDFMPFSKIASLEDVKKYQMMFWLRDVETGNVEDVWNVPESAAKAAPVIETYVKQGGNLLLWQHAVTYIGNINRISTDLLKSVDGSINCGKGGMNPDVWKMGVCVNTDAPFFKDFSTHPIYKGLETENLGPGCPVGIAFKGAGWTEDHNCLFFNIPSGLTGKANNTAECYNSLTTEYGIYPLGTWDSQAALISQLNVWEAVAAPKAEGGYTTGGSILCIGNGGCEFSMKNPDGTPDVSANPKNNSCQGNVLKLAKNSIVYLMSK